MGSRRGLTRIEVVALIVVLLIVAVIGVVIFSGDSGNGKLAVKDASQMRGIHQSW